MSTSPDRVTAPPGDTRRELSTLARVAGALGLARVVSARAATS